MPTEGGTPMLTPTCFTIPALSGSSFIEPGMNIIGVVDIQLETPRDKKPCCEEYCGEN